MVMITYKLIEIRVNCKVGHTGSLDLIYYFIEGDLEIEQNIPVYSAALLVGFVKSLIKELQI